jgi:hypothetical protein
MLGNNKLKKRHYIKLTFLLFVLGFCDLQEGVKRAWTPVIKTHQKLPFLSVLLAIEHFWKREIRVTCFTLARFFEKDLRKGRKFAQFLYHWPSFDLIAPRFLFDQPYLTALYFSFQKCPVFPKHLLSFNFFLVIGPPFFMKADLHLCQ